MKTPSTSSQSGNIFFIILLGVVLFAALSYMVSKSLQSESADKISKREAALAAADIIAYTQKIERTVHRLRSKSISENDISFDNPIVSGYDHDPVQSEKNKIFGAGGRLAWQAPQTNINNGENWIITGSTCVSGIGQGAAGCHSDSLSNEELLLVLPNLKDSVCSELNKALELTTSITDTGTGYSTTKYTGSFADGTRIATATPYKAACVTRAGSNYFYSVLIER